MSSTTAVLPVGPMKQWCLTGFDSSPNPRWDWDLCGNTTRNHERDFVTICCDGEVIDTAFDFWKDTSDTTEVDLADMVCCRQAGLNPGGLLPLPADYTHCASGDPTPLASMAATNTDNAQNFAVTYISGYAGTADWTTRSTPTCLWANTKNVNATTEVTLPAAKITTLPPESSDVGFTGEVGYTLSESATIGSVTSGSAIPASRTPGSTSSSTASATSQSVSSASAVAENATSALTGPRLAETLLVLLAVTLALLQIVVP